MQMDNRNHFVKVYAKKLVSIRTVSYPRSVDGTFFGRTFAPQNHYPFMKQLWLLTVVTICNSVLHAQDWHVGVFGGITGYNGDISDGWVQGHKQMRGALGVTLNYDYNEHISFRAGYTHGKVTGYDKYSTNPEHLKRNLSFETNIDEVSLLAEYYAFNLNERRYSPYFFLGLAAFHFNPYTYDAVNNKVYLKPLSTEGEGLPGYPDSKPYNLTQVAVPFGAGLKFAVSDRVRIGLEVGLRKLFTDYLDDVSKNYPDLFDLLVAKGQKAVELSYRGDEVPGGSPLFPDKGLQRGNKNKDWYYFGGLHLTYRIGGGGGEGVKILRRRSLKGYGCPSSPL